MYGEPRENHGATTKKLKNETCKAIANFIVSNIQQPFDNVVILTRNKAKAVVQVLLAKRVERIVFTWIEIKILVIDQDPHLKEEISVR